MPQDVALNTLLRELIGGRPLTSAPDTGQVDWLARRGLAGLATEAGVASGPLRDQQLAAGLRETLQLDVCEDAVSALRSAGIPGIRLRGAALIGAGLYPVPGSRPMADVDLLVPAQSRRTAFRTLVDIGFRPWLARADPTPAWLDAVTLDAPSSRSGFPLTVDLHWRVSRGGLRFGVPGLEEQLLATPDATDGAPPPDPHFVHIAEHLLRHLRVGVHLPGFVDLVRLAPAIRDWDRVVRLARTGPLAPGTAAILECLRITFGAAIPREVPNAIGPVSPESVFRVDPIRLWNRSDPTRVEGLILRAEWTGGWLAFARELATTAVPPSAWLASRYPDTPRPFRLPRLWAHALAWLVGVARSPVSGNQEFEALPADR